MSRLWKPPQYNLQGSTTHPEQEENPGIGLPAPAAPNAQYWERTQVSRLPTTVLEPGGNPGIRASEPLQITPLGPAAMVESGENPGIQAARETALAQA